MLKRIFSTGLFVFLSIMMLAGCESVDYTDTIEFRLPATSDQTIASYEVELVTPVTQESLGVQEGLPGETLIFEFDRELAYVDATVTALASDGTVLDSTDAIVVDLDWKSPGCSINADSSSLRDNNKTKVSIDVDCYGTDFTTGYNDQDGRPTFNFNLWDIWKLKF